MAATEKFKRRVEMKVSKLIAVSIMTLLCVAMSAGIAASEEISMKGKIKSIDASTNTVVVNDVHKTSENVTLTVEDATAVEQIQAGKIKVGNKAKIKYIKKDGKNVAPYFKKLPGC